jgi:hypothetical protein
MSNITPEEIEQAVAETQQKSFVMIEFNALGSAEFRIFKQNVNPAQVLGALTILELQVKNWYVQEENRKLQESEEMKLSVPKSTILKAK